jgi:hypothetical protein
MEDDLIGTVFSWLDGLSLNIAIDFATNALLDAQSYRIMQSTSGRKSELKVESISTIVCWWDLNIHRVLGNAKRSEHERTWLRSRTQSCQRRQRSVLVQFIEVTVRGRPLGYGISAEWSGRSVVQLDDCMERKLRQCRRRLICSFVVSICHRPGRPHHVLFPRRRGWLRALTSWSRQPDCMLTNCPVGRLAASLMDGPQTSFMTQKMHWRSFQTSAE